MALYVGTNYHPHDWPQERWQEDVRLMKEAGFTTVRLGHLCWDSYEPEDGIYTFTWFDEVMDLFEQAGIGVVLDISMRPAPNWVHKRCPGAAICSKSGAAQASLRRYMEDVDDPDYQYYALRFAKKLVNRYKNHPALFAFGLCNELGDGYLSHSEFARNRFADWLKNKYGTVEEWNQAWASQRWSRRRTSFEDAVIPENEIAVGAPESWLDMRRFFSDGIGNFFIKLKEVVEKNAPGVPHSSNHYAERTWLGFDYMQVCDKAVDYPGMGVYPGYEVGKYQDTILVTYQQRLAELDKPMWCLEFQTGSAGIYCGPYGVNRMHAFLCLLYRAQMILGWTWRSMLGGEEQYLYGMLDHDGTPNPNYREYKQIASDMQKLSDYAFPYVPEPEIAVAYNYDSDWVSQYSCSQYRQPYNASLQQIHRALSERNTDYNIIDLRNMKKNYKLLVIPAHNVMTKQMANTVRSFVEKGGTVIMTGYSAIVDETGKVCSVSRPGYLDDVFGIRVGGFDRLSEDTPKLRVEKDGKSFSVNAKYYEYLELKDAVCFANLQALGRCAVSGHAYGKGMAYYMATEPDCELFGWLLEQISRQAGVSKPLITPAGIHARNIAPDQIFYVNQNAETVEIPLPEPGYGVLSEKQYESVLKLVGYDGELIVTYKKIPTKKYLQKKSKTK